MRTDATDGKAIVFDVPVPPLPDKTGMQILTDIGIGVAAGIGAAAFTSVLGLSIGKGDLKKAVNDILSGVANIVHKAIEGNEIEQATAKMAGLVVLLNEYHSSPSTSLFRLESAITESAQLLSQLAAMMPQASGGYLFAVLVRLAALQELAQITQKSGERANVRNFASAAIPVMRAALEELRNMNEARVSDITLFNGSRVDWAGIDLIGANEMAPSDPTERKIQWAEAYFLLDGHRTSFKDEGGTADQMKESVLNQATAAREATLHRIRSEFQDGVVIPVTENIKQFEAIAEPSSDP